MANTKKKPRERKKSVTFSIKTGTHDDFIEMCLKNDLVPSNVVEELLFNLNKKTNED